MTVLSSISAAYGCIFRSKMQLSLPLAASSPQRHFDSLSCYSVGWARTRHMILRYIDHFIHYCGQHHHNEEQKGSCCSNLAIGRLTVPLMAPPILFLHLSVSTPCATTRIECHTWHDLAQ